MPLGTAGANAGVGPTINFTSSGRPADPTPDQAQIGATGGRYLGPPGSLLPLIKHYGGLCFGGHLQSPLCLQLINDDDDWSLLSVRCTGKIAKTNRAISGELCSVLQLHLNREH